MVPWYDWARAMNRVRLGSGVSFSRKYCLASFMAASIGKQFFPSTDEVASLLATYAAFGIGFVARPLGGILIGRYGDVRGRKAALLLANILLSLGLQPSYPTRAFVALDTGAARSGPACAASVLARFVAVLSAFLRIWCSDVFVQ